MNNPRDRHTPNHASAVRARVPPRSRQAPAATRWSLSPKGVRAHALCRFRFPSLPLADLAEPDPANRRYPGMHAGPHLETADRRRWARTLAAHPCKARLEGEVRFAPGVTHDLSGGGALIEVRSFRALAPGERLELLLAPASCAVVEAKAARPARILRAHRLNDETWRLAIAYDRAAAQAA